MKITIMFVVLLTILLSARCILSFGSVEQREELEVADAGDVFSYLPDYICSNIFSHLNVWDLWRFSLTCRRINNLIDGDPIIAKSFFALSSPVEQDLFKKDVEALDDYGVRAWLTQFAGNKQMIEDLLNRSYGCKYFTELAFYKIRGLMRHCLKFELYQQAVIADDYAISKACFSKDGHYVLTVSYDDIVKIWGQNERGWWVEKCWGTKAIIADRAGFLPEFPGILRSYDTVTMISRDELDTYRTLGVGEDGTWEVDLTFANGVPGVFNLSGDRSHLVVVCKDREGYVKIYGDDESGAAIEKACVCVSEHKVRSVVFSPDGRQIMTVSNGLVKIFELRAAYPCSIKMDKVINEISPVNTHIYEHMIEDSNQDSVILSSMSVGGVLRNTFQRAKNKILDFFNYLFI
ncbi:MAG: F-box/WD40 repeat-containing protein [Candidatus Endonucleobacter bathymodioli]|uniref:F-box/WD40 repeat-containing protein n=1 Tax=Candidatus Endonucleibacter bathymodioli TaxID=539814 RepID=A0AA90NS32_9GAMM|nr:F-box/WD40 repeat-containing protein [Candidatus Endonucleobacter bathymodioli]